MCCSWPCFLVLLCTHYGPLQGFSTKFRKLKEIGVLRPRFPDYVIFWYYGCKGKLISNYRVQLIAKMSLNSPFNINDLTPMNSFSYSTVDKVMLIEFSSLEQTKVSNYFHIHQTGLVMEKLVS